MQEEKWQTSETLSFWGNVARDGHLVQIYESEKVLLETLEGFACAGFLAGESVVIIAEQAHIDQLNRRLSALSLNLIDLAINDQYIVLDAEETLSRFMVNGWPDAAKFRSTILEVIRRARGPEGDRRIRAYGEMVALLWARNKKAATIQLESLWNELQQSEDFTLFCGYPHDRFVGAGDDAIPAVCKTHGIEVAGDQCPQEDISFRQV